MLVGLHLQLRLDANLTQQHYPQGNLGGKVMDKRRAELNQELARVRELGDRPREAETLTELGYLYGDNNQSQEELNYHQQALSITRELGDRYGEDSVQNEIRALTNP